MSAEKRDMYPSIPTPSLLGKKIVAMLKGLQ